MENISVSIIIPTYNRAHLINRAIKSVLSQTLQNFEIIVVDDNSNDNVEEIVKGFNDERIIYVLHKKTRGGSAARNTGIKKSRGKYIAFLDDDDKWLPAKLEKQIEKFYSSSDKVALIYGWAEIRDENGKLSKELKPGRRGETLTQILKGNFLPSSTVVVKRECFNNVGLFDEEFKSCQDREMWTRIAMHYNVEVILENLAQIYRHGGSSIGGSSKKVTYGYYQYFTKFQKEYLQCNMRKELSQNLGWVGYKLAKAGYHKESKESFKLSFKYDKTNLKNYIRFWGASILSKSRISK